MTEVAYPQDWNHESQFGRLLIDIISDADCGWLQAVTDLGFALASVIASCEDDDYRKAVGEVMAAKLLETARTGRIPGEMLQ